VDLAWISIFSFLIRKPLIVGAKWVRILKIKLKGKTLRFRRFSKRSFLIKAGKSHYTFSIVQFGGFMRKKQKQKFFFFGYCDFCLMRSALEFISWKPYNIYHWRGIRLVRMRIYRKAGKVSEYLK
jgi:hypothetical protein